MVPLVLDCLVGVDPEIKKNAVNCYFVAGTQTRSTLQPRCYWNATCTYAICCPAISITIRVQGLPASAYLSSLLAASSISTLSPSYSTTTSPLSISLLANAQIPAFRGSLGTECSYHEEIAQRISCFQRYYSKRESFFLDYSLPKTKTLEQLS